MDVGSVVSFNGLIAAAFALLAGFALAVELGTAPKAKKVKPAEEDQGDSEGNEVKPSAITEAYSPAVDAIQNLQRTYVDGLLGSRGKYDVSLAILNAHETTGVVSEEEAGLMVATQAYLSATRSGSAASGSFLSLANVGGFKTIASIKRTGEQSVPAEPKKASESRKTSELNKEPESKNGTSEMKPPSTRRRPAASRPSSEATRSRKTNSGDGSEKL
jgi:hypothetical protein